MQNSKIIPYKTKEKRLSGTNYAEIKKEAQIIFNEIKRKTKRQPYIRSAYFKKQKVFFNYFWTHLAQKNLKEKVIPEAYGDYTQRSRNSLINGILNFLFNK